MLHYCAILWDPNNRIWSLLINPLYWSGAQLQIFLFFSFFFLRDLFFPSGWMYLILDRCLNSNPAQVVCPSVICSRSIRGAPWDSSWSFGAETFLTFCTCRTHGPTNWSDTGDEETHDHFLIRNTKIRGSLGTTNGASNSLEINLLQEKI